MGVQLLVVKQNADSKGYDLLKPRNQRSQQTSIWIKPESSKLDFVALYTFRSHLAPQEDHTKTEESIFWFKSQRPSIHLYSFVCFFWGCKPGINVPSIFKKQPPQNSLRLLGRLSRLIIPHEPSLDLFLQGFNQNKQCLLWAVLSDEQMRNGWPVSLLHKWHSQGSQIRWGFCSHQPVIKKPTSNGGDAPDKSPVVKAKTLPTCLGIVKGIWLGFSDGFVLVGSRWGLFFSKPKKRGPKTSGVHHKNLVTWENQPWRLTGIVPWWRRVSLFF